ncbi:mannose-1-phosphate guanylyltransferase [Ranunculus cassubicifolius]
MAEKVVAVIMVGGPTKGTRFRSLSLNFPKPLFPLAGKPMIHHPITAYKSIPNLVQIYLIGFYEEREFAMYASSVSNELQMPLRYLREDKPHGSAGGLYNFRDLSHIVLLNVDVCCSFPLLGMFEAHKRYGGMGTIMVIKVLAELANQFGELVSHPVSNELLHYTEKPETFVSDLINCGVYIFTPDIFTAIQDVTIRRDEEDCHLPLVCENFMPTSSISPHVSIFLCYNIFIISIFFLPVLFTNHYSNTLNTSSFLDRRFDVYIIPFLLGSKKLLWLWIMSSWSLYQTRISRKGSYCETLSLLHTSRSKSPTINLNFTSFLNQFVNLVLRIILDVFCFFCGILVLLGHASLGCWQRVLGDHDRRATHVALDPHSLLQEPQLPPSKQLETSSLPSAKTHPFSPS